MSPCMTQLIPCPYNHHSQMAWTVLEAVIDPLFRNKARQGRLCNEEGQTWVQAWELSCGFPFHVLDPSPLRGHSGM